MVARNQTGTETRARNVEDIYVLSPLQRGMLLHSMHDGAADMYLSQQTYLADGNLDPDVLVRSWQAVVADSPVLRTSFHWEGLDRPLQVVHREVTLPVTRHDWTGHDPAKQVEMLARLRARDAAAGIDVTVAPLQRLAVVRLDAQRCCLVWTYHHLLMDGWSIPLFMGTLLAHYRALLAGTPPPPVPRPFRDYIAWLQSQDPEAGRSYWTELLGGTVANPLLPLRPWDPLGGTGAVDRRDIRMPEAWPQELRAAAARHRVTRGTMVQAAWALVLRRYSARADVVFGCVSSGRPPDLPGADRIIGVFANMLPTPVTVPEDGDVGTWLRGVQQLNAQMRRFEYSPLSDIKKWAGSAGRQLFESSLSIENYSVAVDGQLLTDEVSFRQEALYDKINYPIAITITPELGAVQLLVHRDRFGPEFLDDALAALRAVLAALPAATTMAELLAALGPIPDAVTAAPALSPSAVPGGPPVTDAERAVAAVFAEILEVDLAELDVTANFFELGGDSFDAVRAISRIAGASVALLAAHPSVRELAAVLADDAVLAAGPVPVPRTGPLVCTFQQEGMWFQNQLLPEWASYHVPVALRLHGDLDVAALGRAMYGLVARHEALRTRFVAIDGLPRQVVDPPPEPAALPVAEVSPADLVAWASAIYAAPFDLATGPGFRFAVARLGPGEFATVLVFHHIVTDGWSAGLLAAELSARYADPDAAALLPPLALQPADYAAWQRTTFDSAERDRQVGHWVAALDGLATVAFPADRPRPARPTGAGANVARTLPRGVADAAHAYSRTEQVSMLAILQAGLLTVLQRWTGQADIPIGSLLTGRTSVVVEPMVGYFGSIVVLRTDLSGEPTFGELVRRCHATVLDATSHQDTPFPLVVDALAPPRVPGRNPLFQIGLTYNPPGMSAALTLGEVTGEAFTVHEEHTLWDFAVDVNDPADGNLYVSIDYSAELYDAERMERFADHLTEALSTGLAAPDTRLAEVEIVPATERPRTLPVAGEPARPVEPVHRTMAGLAATTPDAEAVPGITYAELDRAANRLAHRLRGAGLAPGGPVAVAADPGAGSVTALLAVWKAGGHVVPLDRAADGLVVADRARPDLPEAIVPGDGPDGMPEDGGSAAARAAVVRAADGSPVALTHAELAAEVHRMQVAVPLTATDRVVGHVSHELREGLVELLWPLAAGAAVVPDTASATVLVAPPATVRDLLAGSDAPVPRLVLRRSEPAAATARRVRAAWPGTELVELDLPELVRGRPAAGVTAAVLDERGRPAPIGVPGRLWTGTEPVATGLTARTCADGRIEVQGLRALRAEVRGEPVDLGRIEDALLDHPAVRHAVVSVVDERAVAAVVPDGSGEVDLTALQRHLAEALPRTLVPRTIAVVPDLPRTADGRLARTAAPPPAPAPVPPRTATERRLAAIWAELLADRPGAPTTPEIVADVDADLFDLGAGSLHAARLVARLRTDPGIEIAITDLFNHPTVRLLAALIDSRDAS